MRNIGRIKYYVARMAARGAGPDAVPGIGAREKAAYNRNFKTVQASKESRVSQKAIQACMAPGSHAWRALKDGRTCWHLPPLKRCSVRWDVPGGEVAAATQVIRDSWSLYSSDKGLTLAACPISNLFVAAPAAAADASG